MKKKEIDKFIDRLLEVNPPDYLDTVKLSKLKEVREEFIEYMNLSIMNAEMGNEIIGWMKYEMQKYSCEHRLEGEKIDAPAMMFPEQLHCIVNHARKEGMERFIRAYFLYGKSFDLPKVGYGKISLELAQRIWKLGEPKNETSTDTDKE